MDCTKLYYSINYNELYLVRLDHDYGIKLGHGWIWTTPSVRVYRAYAYS
jgi:hypothetical protein